MQWMLLRQNAWKELYMEGFRLHDLKRWHKGFERKTLDQSLANGSSFESRSWRSFVLCGLYRSTNWTLRAHKSNRMKVTNKIKKHTINEEIINRMYRFHCCLIALPDAIRTRCYTNGSSYLMFSDNFILYAKKCKKRNEIFNVPVSATKSVWLRPHAGCRSDRQRKQCPWKV